MSIREIVSWRRVLRGVKLVGGKEVIGGLGIVLVGFLICCVILKKLLIFIGF